MTDAAAALVDRRPFPAETKLTLLDGPVRAFSPSTGDLHSSTFPWPAFANAVRDTAAFCRTHRRMPDEVWIGAESLSPADYLATLGGALERVITSGDVPTAVERRVGHYTADQYVAEDSPKLWDWPIFPHGFHAPHLMELARLQAWTLKVALLHH
jgi:hypothetical protein